MSKRIVVPGELVTDERKRLGSNVFLREGKIFSDSIGFVSDSDTTTSVVPLKGVYRPIMGDVIVGIVAGERFSSYDVDINSFYLANVSKKELREMLQPFSIVSAKVIKVNEMNEVLLGFVRVLFGGEIIDVSAVKVPRVIGRNGSMLEVVKKGTGCNFFVGKNGKIWVKGGKVDLLKLAIKMIEEKAHEDNLTNKVAEFLEKENGSPQVGANEKQGD
ncbi:MAG: KH domain-containing protein [archaeon]